MFPGGIPPSAAVQSHLPDGNAHAARALVAQQYAKRWLELPWQKVRESVEVKLFVEDGELYVLAKSEGRYAKERAIRRRKLVRLLKTLRRLRRSAPARDQLLLRIGAAKKDAGRAFGFVTARRIHPNFYSVRAGVSYLLHG